MIGEKVLHFQDKHVDFASLQSKIEQYLTADGFTVATAVPSDHGTVIQAKKGLTSSAYLRLRARLRSCVLSDSRK